MLEDHGLKSIARRKRWVGLANQELGQRKIDSSQPVRAPAKTNIPTLVVDTNLDAKALSQSYRGT